LISVNTQCNINKEIKRLIANNVLKLKINNDIYTKGSIDLLIIVGFIKIYVHIFFSRHGYRHREIRNNILLSAIRNSHTGLNRFLYFISHYIIVQ